jgi:DNA-binding protein YbaB
VSNDAARHDLNDLLARVQEQMADFATLQKKRAALTARASTAEGTVEVTVNAQGTVVRTVIDEAYFDEFDLPELGNYITSAAQTAAQEVWRRSAELLAPLTERRSRMPSLSDHIEGAPDVGNLLSGFDDPTDQLDTEAAQPEWDRPDSAPVVRRA